MKTILIEQREIVRLGMRIILHSIEGLTVAGEFSDGRTAVQQAPIMDPDLALLGIELPELDGIKVTAALKKTTSAKVIVVTSHDHSHNIFAALGAGADAYCLQGLSRPQLVKVINCVMGGGLWLDASVATTVRNALRGGGNARMPAAPLALEQQLSVRELQVLTLVAEGLTNQQIAERLKISSETIKTHIRHVMEKLCVSDRTEAAVKALSHGLVVLPAVDAAVVPGEPRADAPDSA